MTTEPFVRGHCLCGAVTFTIHGEPIGTGQCHCKDCQRSSGTGHMSLARFKKEDVRLQGETASYAATADSGNINTRHFCPKCGSRLYGENSAFPGIMNVSVGCMDDSNWFVPGRVVYAKDRPSWDATSTSVPNFDRMPP
ncbi:MAG: GFA family protein [Acetobacteraceae bacterium]|nr:GFA family protein [Acetobacteraceae bacterium]